jgi:hypothetical protein
LLDAHQQDSASVLCYCLGPKRVHPKKVRRRHEQIPPSSPNQSSRPIAWYREVVSALGFQLRPELLSLDRPLNQRPPDAADSQLERTALCHPPGERRYIHIDSLFSTQVERELIETIGTETAPNSAPQINEAHASE